MSDNPWSAPSGPPGVRDVTAPQPASWPPLPAPRHESNPASGPAPMSPTPGPGRPARPRRPALVAGLVGGAVGALVAAGVSVATVRITEHRDAARTATSVDTGLPDGGTTVPAPTATPATASVVGATSSGPPPVTTRVQSAPATTAPAGAAAAAPLSVKGILAKVSPSVVAIEVRLRNGSAAGTGVIISADGLVLTNAHVVNGAAAMAVKFADGTTSDAELVGAAASRDVALVKIRGASGLTPATLGSSAALSVGDDVIAIGNALDLGAAPSVTRGIVSAKDRSLDTGENLLANLIQTDAAINHGNSGGPLVNMAGEVVGINTAGIENASNLGFAIEIDAIKPVIDQIRAGTNAAAQVAYLGVQTLNADELDSQTAAQYGVTPVTPGAVVVSVVAGSPASQAGLRVGDVIQKLDGKAVTSKDGVRTAIAAHKPGDAMAIEVLRGGQTATLDAVLGSRAGN